MKKGCNSAAYKAALANHLADKVLSPEVKVTKEAIEDYCMEKQITNGLGTSACLRLALAHYVYMLLKFGYNGRDVKAIIKRVILFVLDSIEIKEEEK